MPYQEAEEFGEAMWQQREELQKKVEELRSLLKDALYYMVRLPQNEILREKIEKETTK